MTVSLDRTEPAKLLFLMSSVSMWKNNAIIAAVIVATAKKVNSSPTYQGVPVGCTFLIQQSQPIFTKQFPGLEISPVFSLGQPNNTYREQGLIYPTQATLGIPVYRKFSPLEEARLGSSGIKKKQVAQLVIDGKCKYACANVYLVKMTLYKCEDEQPTDEIIWQYP